MAPLPIKFTETLNLTSVGILVSTSAAMSYTVYLVRAYLAADCLILAAGLNRLQLMHARIRPLRLCTAGE